MMEPWEMTEDEFYEAYKDRPHEQGLHYLRTPNPKAGIGSFAKQIEQFLRDRHRKLVMAALAEGRPVPLANRPVWAWTYAQYAAKWGDNDVSRMEHEEEVRAAIEAGWPVPPEVLAEYPQLAEEAKKNWEEG